MFIYTHIIRFFFFVHLYTIHLLPIIHNTHCLIVVVDDDDYTTPFTSLFPSSTSFFFRFIFFGHTSHTTCIRCTICSKYSHTHTYTIHTVTHATLQFLNFIANQQKKNVHTTTKKNITKPKPSSSIVRLHTTLLHSLMLLLLLHAVALAIDCRTYIQYT